MISLNAIHARIKRQKIRDFSGNYFVNQDELIAKIPYLKKHEEQQFLFGIYNSSDRWTAISVNFLYSFHSGKLSILQLDIDTDKVYDYFTIDDNEFSNEVFLKDGRIVWMFSPELCSLILNVMLMLKKIPCGVKLK